MFQEAKPRETLKLKGNKIYWFPSLKVICWIDGNFEAGNSLNLAVMVVITQHELLTSHIIDFLQCSPL